MQKVNLIIGLVLVFLMGCSPAGSVVTNETAGYTAVPSVTPAGNTPAAMSSTPPPVENTSTAVKLTATPIPQPKAYIIVPEGDEEYVVVRSGPGVTYNRVGILKVGEKAAALARSPGGDWIQIKYSGSPNGLAWVYVIFVRLEGENLPVIDPATGQTLAPMATLAPPAGNQKDITVIKAFLKQNDSQITFLGEDRNLNNFSNPNQRVNRYEVNGTLFSVDLQTKQIVEIDTRGMNLLPAGKPLSTTELEQKARNLISELAPDVNLDKLTAQPGVKGSNVFMRWEDKKGDFIQVGLTADGQLLNYVNGLN
jgi:hypothetical protein